MNGPDRSTLLDAAASLFLRRNLCFRETLNNRTCLVFPSLINEKRPTNGDGGLLDDASPELKRLRTRLRDQRLELETRLARSLNAAGMEPSVNRGHYEPAHAA